VALTSRQVALAAYEVGRSVPCVSAETPAAETPAGEAPAAARPGPAPVTSSHLADALLVIAETFLAGEVADAENPDVYQVIVHAGAGALAASGPEAEAEPWRPIATEIDMIAAIRQQCQQYALS
jgi:hypothetical protein